MLEQCGIDVVEGVHAHHGIRMAFDLARYHGHRAAARADVEARRLRAEGVMRDERRILHLDVERALRVRRPHAAVLAAERAGAGTRGNLFRLRRPVEPERDVAAVAAAVDVHEAFLASHSRRSNPYRAPSLVSPRMT